MGDLKKSNNQNINDSSPWKYSGAEFIQTVSASVIKQIADILQFVSSSGPMVFDGYRYWLDDDKLSLCREKDYREYDEIADAYQELFTDEDSLAENELVTKLIADNFIGSVYEIGCGSGLLLDYYDIPTDKYIGIDPSQKMLGYLSHKHPEYNVRNIPFELDGDAFKEYDNVVALFGSPSYIPEIALSNLSSNHKGLFLMFYRDTYEPVTYKATKTSMHHHKYTLDQLVNIFPGCEVIPMLNYFVVSSKHLDI